MQLHELKSNGKNKEKTRVGRGGKRGTYSGRGQKGQKSRSGRRIRPAERDLIQRLPKLRGFRNKSLFEKPTVVDIADIEKKVNNNLINREVLLSAGLIRKSAKKIKILGVSESKKPFEIEGLEISNKLKEKIISAGGSIK
ncbi:50S ribosomal protein L15 [Candidatus Wolfebacteria bacterium RIFCSPLOWO2_01_FULL_38_11]|uniref:Large ribosomal subunit protein uL15 n=2 Tax=Candidatus Wolfeibacteriota TaxID=1752735 RepID=A0A0G0FWD1_9BACT|nr:MAG: 50S ribosomal protein L15, large subunit ribosomal protein L15 [Candidatus Wolfebacteria bacterium GW2011_GWC1_37_10]OGM91368.1 MAG: 50S ribosomal protein L15 [Candidatus Wolfebacteria bacterium RIFCSPLOWO2_01_FULL_38_11]